MCSKAKTRFESSNYREYLGSYASGVESELSRLEKNRFAERFFKHDNTLWNNDSSEISNRLGWVYLPEKMLLTVEEIDDFTESIKKKRFTDVVVLGMGGSSLSSEVFRNIFPARDDFLRLTLVDTTDADFICKTEKSLDLSKTLFVVSSKSGSTVETVSLMNYFYERVSKRTDSPGEHFVCITDPGSKLLEIAREHRFAKVFINDPNVGGRFSVLSYFGLVPASLAGIDIRKVLQSAASVTAELKNAVGGKYGQSTSFRLGVFLGLMANEGRDKLCFFFSEKLSSFGYWAEQLIAESLGKDGVGILPLLDEEKTSAHLQKKDRAFLLFSLRGDETIDTVARELSETKAPFVSMVIDDPYEIAEQFFRFEFAVAVAGSIMKINPFDQPDVESSKAFSRNFLKFYQETGKFDLVDSDFSWRGLVFSSNGAIKSPEDLKNLASSKNNGYISIHAYVDPGEENLNELLRLRARIEKISSVPVTLGFGPRFLHSTGQLHKGDSGEGIFIQIVSDNENDLRIPTATGSSESVFSFATLKTAQAIGDFKSLDEKGREVIRIGISSNVSKNIQTITNLFI